MNYKLYPVLILFMVVLLAALPSCCLITITYTVTFDSQGGSVVASRTVSSGASVGTLPNSLYPGYNFNGWYTQPNGGGNLFSAGTIVNADITLFAYWISIPRNGLIGEWLFSGNIKDSSGSGNNGTVVNSQDLPSTDLEIRIVHFSAKETIMLLQKRPLS